MTESTTQSRPSANALYNEAQKRLRLKYPDEFADFIEQVYTEHGLSYRRRRTAEERDAQEKARRLRKAQRTVDKLFAEFGDDVLPEQQQAG